MENADLIYSYTRAEAIDDGVLIDVTKWSRPRGFRFPVAFSAAAYYEVVTKGEGKTEEERIDHPLTHLLHVITAAKRVTDRVTFGLMNAEEFVDLYAVLSPGDDMEPVITVMLIGED